MAYSLDGPQLRLRRAHEHIQALYSQISYFLDSRPYTFVREVDPETGDWIYRVRLRQPLPAYLSLLVGDCVHNLRSSLDHLVWQLASLHRDPDPPFERTEFPIFWEEDAFLKAQWKIQDVPPDARDVIKRLQPYQRPDDPQWHPLWVLHRLWNDDKHRTIPILYSQLNATAINVHEAIGRGPFGSETYAGPFDDGSVLARIRVPQGPDAKVNIDTSFQIGVAFDKEGPARGRPVVDALAELHYFIRQEVLPAFAGFFPQSGI